jgi:hypothetical protein
MFIAVNRNLEPGEVLILLENLVRVTFAVPYLHAGLARSVAYVPRYFLFSSSHRYVS